MIDKKHQSTVSENESNLRTRIATAIRKAAHDTGSSYPPGPHVAGIYADAVINELRLSVDRGVIIGCDGKCATHECVCPTWYD